MCDPHHVTHPDPCYACELKKDGDAFMMADVMCRHISMKREHHDLSVFLMLYMGSVSSPAERNAGLYC